MIVGAQRFGGEWVLIGLVAAALVLVLIAWLLAAALLAGVVGQRKRAAHRDDLDGWDRR